MAYYLDGEDFFKQSLYVEKAKVLPSIESMLLRVHISPTNIRRVKLPERPELRKANDIYHQTKKPLTVPRDMKCEILDKIVQAIFEIKAYPDAYEIQSIASALDSDITTHREKTVLEGLPLFLREKSACLLKMCLDTDPVNRSTKDVKIGILTVVEDNVAAVTSLPTVTNMAIILEEAIVLEDIKDLPSAFAYLFGLLYVLNMEYPKELKYTFEVIQKIFMDLGGTCSAKVQSLKSKLC
ncbi:uncharacterized protein LOC131530097 [Onychostoma macrolepis]|uniref:uncharacterized protein LOC131530097 n=1 Tax=Onychostoma macrolepis TaxID=369639 RepID=UPI00272B1DDD|nr:uncharacterized protein LOC131530097 [Onychostoma macrolepis]